MVSEDFFSIIHVAILIHFKPQGLDWQNLCRGLLVVNGFPSFSLVISLWDPRLYLHEISSHLANLH